MTNNIYQNTAIGIGAIGTVAIGAICFDMGCQELASGNSLEGITALALRIILPLGVLCLGVLHYRSLHLGTEIREEREFEKGRFLSLCESLNIDLSPILADIEQSNLSEEYQLLEFIRLNDQLQKFLDTTNAPAQLTTKNAEPTQVALRPKFGKIEEEVRLEIIRSVNIKAQLNADLNEKIISIGRQNLPPQEKLGKLRALNNELEKLLRTNTQRQISNRAEN